MKNPFKKIKPLYELIIHKKLDGYFTWKAVIFMTEKSLLSNCTISSDNVELSEKKSIKNAEDTMKIFNIRKMNRKKLINRKSYVNPPTQREGRIVEGSYIPPCNSLPPPRPPKLS